MIVLRGLLCGVMNIVVLVIQQNNGIKKQSIYIYTATGTFYAYTTMLNNLHSNPPITIMQSLNAYQMNIVGYASNIAG